MDIMVLTAAIPGAPPPKLLSREMIKSMAPGSVIVDIAASAKFAKQYKAGDASSPWPGNCELTVPGEKIVTENGVTIVGYTDLPARFAQQATDFYCNCLVNLIEGMCFKGTIRERGGKKPEVGTASDFKVDMTVIREQALSDDKGSTSYWSGTYAVGDDVMAGMVVVKVEGDKSLIDFPKPPPKPMITTQAQFENRMKELPSSDLRSELQECMKKRSEAYGVLKSVYKADSIDQFWEALDAQPSSEDKIKAIKAFEQVKDYDGFVNSLPKLIEKKVAEEAKALQQTEVQGNKAPLVGLLLLFPIGFALMAFGPAPPLFIGNVMVFLLASFLGYHLITEVKPSLYTPLMSMSNAISGIVIVGGMLQVQGKYLWPETGTATQILGAVATAVSAVNIFGGFAVTLRMLSMFKKS